MQNILQLLQFKHAVHHEEAFLSARELADLMEVDLEK